MGDPRELIDGMLERYKVAFFSKDVDAFAGLYDPNVRIFGTWGEWSYDGLDEWRVSAKAWFDSLTNERVLVVAEAIEISASGELAAVNGFMVFKAMSQAGVELRSTKSRFTWTVERRFGVWKVVHEHTSFPLDF
jgi:ketosteroid isomerase-like protein